MVSDLFSPDAKVVRAVKWITPHFAATWKCPFGDGFEQLCKFSCSHLKNVLLIAPLLHPQTISDGQVNGKCYSKIPF